jgi:hypothetical protein
MRPAFSSTKQATAFAFMLLVILLSPVLVGKNLLPPREEVYTSQTWRYCACGFLDDQIFKEKSDIDVVFIGSSRMWAGIDTPYVQQEFSKKLGRPAVVLTLAWSWTGFDSIYFIGQDLFQHRKVRMIVFDDEFRDDDVPNVSATHWFRFGDNWKDVAGMPLRIQSDYYLAAIWGMPRNLLSLLRLNISTSHDYPDFERWAAVFHSKNPRNQLGALTVERNFDPGIPFVPYLPGNDARTDSACVFSPETKEQFEFSGPRTPAWQMSFAKKFADMAANYNAKAVFLHLNPIYSSNETNNPRIHERECWPQVLGTNVAMVGIAPEKLYSGLDESDLGRLFFMPDHIHYNENGEKLFTPLITPALLQIYENQTAH